MLHFPNKSFSVSYLFLLVLKFVFLLVYVSSIQFIINDFMCTDNVLFFSLSLVPFCDCILSYWSFESIFLNVRKSLDAVYVRLKLEAKLNVT